jgi:hypothetical protein
MFNSGISAPSRENLALVPSRLGTPDPVLARVVCALSEQWAERDTPPLGRFFNDS